MLDGNMAETVPHLQLKHFDAKWYLQKYPDLQKAGVNPLQHFKNNGWKEGRWPCGFESVELDAELWSSTHPESVLQRLKGLKQSGNDIENGLAAWFLGRWFASRGEWKNAFYYIKDISDTNEAFYFIKHDGFRVLLFSCLYHLNMREQAMMLARGDSWLNQANQSLALSMIAEECARFVKINQFLKHQTLIGFSTRSTDLDNLCMVEYQKSPPKIWDKLVSVIIPCFNAQSTIETAIQSLLNQTYSKLEIIIVDDASTDKSPEIVKKLQGLDNRIRYIKLPENKGAYHARNIGLKASKGRFITTHDSDDWSHPQKIELQVAALTEKRKTKASVSHWARCNGNLEFQRWRIEDGWVHRNVSSLMFKRSVFRRLGFWDSVSVNADTEFYYRLISVYGNKAITEVTPGTPLSFGRVTSDSLTQSGPTHIRTQFVGIRKDYMDSAIEWHNSGKRLFMPLGKKRKFIAPPYICRGTKQSNKDNLKKALEKSKLFDKDWYLTKNQDVKNAGVEPLQHFINHGVFEGRDPNQQFSLSAYAMESGLSLYNAFLLWISQHDCCDLPIFIGGQHQVSTAKQSIMMFAHSAGDVLFGAEKSFLDCVRMLNKEQFNVYIVLPSALNKKYVEALSKESVKIFFIPLCWWQMHRAVLKPQVDTIEKTLHELNIKKVYVNTITLWEPIIAAKELGVESIMHIRELPDGDESLCGILSANPDEIKAHVRRVADRYIANSKTTLDYYHINNGCSVVPNVVDSESFSKSEKAYVLPLVVTMISSNIKKKGLEDLFKVAECCNESKAPVLFRIYGPETALLCELLTKHELANISYEGYVTDPISALNKAHVILNLSHFNESFGRTVIEGMAAGCVPVVYQKGALVELVDDTNGFLIPFGRPDIVASRLLELTEDRGLFESLATASRNKVTLFFSSEIVASRFSSIFA